MATKENYLSAAVVATKLLHHPAVAAAWQAPSALEKMSVGALAAHLSRQIVLIPGIVAAAIPDDEPLGLLDHYSRVQWRGADLDDEVNRSIRETGQATAEPGPAAIAAEAQAAAVELPQVLAGEADGRAVRLPWTGWALTLEDFLVTRTMEIVVHSDDLAVSVGIPTPEFPAGSVEAVVDLLTRLSIQRHGPMALVRALSRAERAPATIAAI